MRREADNRFALLNMSLDITTPDFATNSSFPFPHDVSPRFDEGLSGPRLQLIPPPFEHNGALTGNLGASSIIRGFEALTGIFPGVASARILSAVLTLDPSLEATTVVPTTDAPSAPLNHVNDGPTEEPTIQEPSVGEVQAESAESVTSPDSIPVELLSEFSARDFVECPSLFDLKTPESGE